MGECKCGSRPYSSRGRRARERQPESCPEAGYLTLTVVLLLHRSYLVPHLQVRGKVQIEHKIRYLTISTMSSNFSSVCHTGGVFNELQVSRALLE